MKEVEVVEVIQAQREVEGGVMQKPSHGNKKEIGLAQIQAVPTSIFHFGAFAIAAVLLVQQEIWQLLEEVRGVVEDEVEVLVTLGEEEDPVVHQVFLVQVIGIVQCVAT